MSVAVIPTLSREALKSNALAFANRWAGKHGEDAEAKSFLDEFFRIFGRDRRAVDAEFEVAVKRDGRGDGFIDLFWPGKLIVEMKSTGKDLTKAAKQAFDYVADLEDPTDVPQWVLVCDFASFALYDLGEHPDELLNAFKVEKSRKGRLVTQFPLEDLPKHLGAFGFIRDEEQNLFCAEPLVNRKAVKLLGKLHDSLETSGYAGHALERFLVRILFCLFAEDTDIFPWNGFSRFVHASKRDGSDLGERLGRLFQTLDTEKRPASLPAAYAEFPYINGGLFRERLDVADLNTAQRTALIDCCRFDWSRISPAVFGSLFQGVMLPAERREKGAHYTSEENIRKVIDPLFLEDLRAELQKLAEAAPTKARAGALAAYHDKLAALRLLDPACGCGNFLVVAYRELRLLELETLKLLHPADAQGRRQGVLNIGDLVKVSVDRMYGIEIDEFPALIAETALWLTDHQVNMAVSKAFGQNFLRIPLKASAHILHANALRTDWNRLTPGSIHLYADSLHVNLVEEPSAVYGRVTVTTRKLSVNQPGAAEDNHAETTRPPVFDYILGNPPFIGHQWRDAGQAADMETVWGGDGRFGRLDYVTAWYRKASDYMKANPGTTTAFVSTNSITQGEQVATLWEPLLHEGIVINFAHRTFAWQNEASGKAAVHCVIIGFALRPYSTKRLYDYATLKSSPIERLAGNINPYLVDAPNVMLPSRSDTPPGMPQMKKGSQPTDGGFLILTNDKKAALLREEPAAEKWLRPYMGGEEFINGGHRWCLWLKNASPAELRASRKVLALIEGVRQSRLKSPTKSVRDFAASPTLFTQDRQPDAEYLAVPEVSSENREYIPIGFLPPEVIGSNKLQMIVGATRYHFGVLSSHMHMAWMRAVCGRLESRLSYAPNIYNTSPWPTPDDAKRAAVEKAAQAVLDARAPHLTGGSTLADLYDPLTMPADLRRAHDALDRAVDAAYAYKGAPDDAARTAFLFRLYQSLATPLAPDAKPAKPKKTKPESHHRGTHT